jgi:hypothetical protein
VDTHVVARLEAGYFAQLAALEILDGCAHVERAPEGRRIVAEPRG